MLDKLKSLMKRHLHVNIRNYLVAASTLLAAGVIFLIGLFSYNSAVDSVTQHVEALDQQTAVQQAGKLDYSLNEIPSIVNDLARNKDILANLAQFMPGMDVSLQVLDEAATKQLLQDEMIGMDSPLEGIGVFKDGIALSQGQGIAAIAAYVMSHPSFQNLNETPASFVLTGEEGAVKNSSYPPFKGIYFARNLTDTAGKRWILVVKVRGTLLSDLFVSSGPGMVCNAGGLVWCTDKAIEPMYGLIKKKMTGNHGSFREHVGNGDYLFSYQQCGQQGWTVVRCNDLQAVSQSIGRLRMILFLVTAICLVICVALTLAFSKSITRSIRSLQSTVEQYRLDGSVVYRSPRGRKHSFRFIILSFFLLLVILPLSIYIALFSIVSSNLTNNEIVKSVNATLSQTADNIDLFVAANERISVRILLAPCVQDLLDPSFSGKITDDQIYEVIEENLSFEHKVFETNLFSYDGRLLFSTSYLNREYAKTSNLYMSAKDSLGYAVWVSYSVDPYNRNVINLTRKIYTDQGTIGTISPIGYLSMTYLETYIHELYSDVSIGGGYGNIFIVKTDGTIVSSKYKNMIGTKYDITNIQKAIDSKSGIGNSGSGTLLYAAPCKNVPWVVVAEVDAGLINSNSRNILVTNIYAGLVILLAAMGLSYLIVYALTKPVKSLRNVVASYTAGSGEITLPGNLEYINEVEELGQTFNEMSRRINSLIDTVYVSQLKATEMEREMKSAELIALQSQINPHFLYNTLESIKWMVRSGKSEKANQIISLLGDLFALGVGSENQLFTLEEEMKCSQAYIDIQKIRLGDKLACHWNIDEAMRHEVRVPKMVLQPLIENAIQHGIQKATDGGNVSIQCHAEGEDRAVITVMDDGDGISPERLKEIRDSLMAQDMGGHNIGIFNVHKRIRLFFGAEYGLSIDSHPAAGTIVQLTVPRQKSQG